MQAIRYLWVMVIVHIACGCSAPSAPPHVQAPAAGAEGATSRAAAPRPDEKLSDEINKALLKGDLEEASAIVERAGRASSAMQPSARALAYYRATVRAYQGDPSGAAKVLYDHIAAVGATTADAFYFHDAMIALRTADGDILGALVECEEMVKAGSLGTWKPSGGERMTLVRLKEHWHRAYLLRMFAQTLKGSAREAMVAYAEAARRDYVALANPLDDLRDSIAVLDAYFAFCDGVPARMREAASRVNVAKDDDVEDLYLVQLALEGAGDREAAAAVRKRMLALTDATVLTPVFVTWMRTDDAAGPQHRFSPKYPTGVRSAP